MKTTKKFKVLGPVATQFGAATTGNWRLERPQVDFSRCTKCRTCELHCPTNVMEIKKDQEECVVINFDYCKGCGICTNVCPVQCISLVEERR
ncbi:MAG: 4Fe-4S binding protein [Eubacteriales bacterium]|nr:4Fe-4S binding protein [Eubacteriales bacterium]